VDKLIPLVSSVGSPPTMPVCRLAHPRFAKMMAEYLVAQVIVAERK